MDLQNSTAIIELGKHIENPLGCQKHVIDDNQQQYFTTQTNNRTAELVIEVIKRETPNIFLFLQLMGTNWPKLVMKPSLSEKCWIYSIRLWYIISTILLYSTNLLALGFAIPISHGSKLLVHLLVELVVCGQAVSCGFAVQLINQQQNVLCQYEHIGQELIHLKRSFRLALYFYFICAG